MKQIFLKSSFHVGWIYIPAQISLDGSGDSSIQSDAFSTNDPKCVVPLDGTFRNLAVYSPVGFHQDYTITLMKNGVATTLTCTLASTATNASDKIHEVTVVAGDDVFIRIDFVGFGPMDQPMNFSLEFEGATQFYPIAGCGTLTTAGATSNAGGLGNGRWATDIPPLIANSYSTCAVPGTITGLRLKSFFAEAGGSWTARIRKNLVLQDGTGGTVDTTCTLVDDNEHATVGFTLPVAFDDNIDVMLTRNTTNADSINSKIAASVTFVPTDGVSFMMCGGNNNAMEQTLDTEYVWMQSLQLANLESKVKCPIGATGLVITGLHVEDIGEIDPTNLPGIQSRVFTIVKNGVDTAAIVTISEDELSGSIGGLEILFVEGDYIALKCVAVNGANVTPIGMKWGISAKIYKDRSGIYFSDKTEKHDNFYGDVEKKIPDPTIRTALLGD